MSTWKQSCLYCSDTVSTGSLNRGYYKMHLENVHGIQHNSEKLLTWTLAQQNLSGGKGGKGGGSTLSSVASILGMKGITITKDTSSPSNGVPNSLINIKGITVQKVSDDIHMGGSPVTGAVMGRGGRGGMNRPPSAIARQQEQAIERWSNACEHGCRMCRREGKNFTTFHRNTLIKHLEQNHKIGERDYKEEFKCQNLITRASNMSCLECKQKVKRIPSSLSAHMKKHGLTIRQYWIKHIAPKGSALASYTGPLRTAPPLRGAMAGRGWVRGGMPPRGRGGFQPQFRGGVRPILRQPGSQTNKSVNGNFNPKVMLNRVDDDTIAREEAGLGGDDAMEVELDPLTLLEMGMGEDFIQLEGVAVKEEVDSAGEGEGDGDGEDMESVQITPDEDDQGRDLSTPDVKEDDEAEVTAEGDGGEENQDEKPENEDIEVLCDVTALKADPKTAIPLPDLSSPTKEGETRSEPEPINPEDKTSSEDGGSERNDKPAVNKHSIGNILSDPPSQVEATKPPIPEEPVNQYSQEHSSPVKQPAIPPQSFPTPPVSTPSYPDPNQGFQQPPFQSYPNQPPSFPSNPYSAYAPYQAGPFDNNYPPTTNQNYASPPNGSAYHPPAGNQPSSYPPVTQGAYPPSFVPNPFSAPKTRWDTLSCPYSIVQCPLYCCHVRGMQEIEEGSTDWSRPYGPPASGFGERCTCCINT